MEEVLLPSALFRPLKSEPTKTTTNLCVLYSVGVRTFDAQKFLKMRLAGFEEWQFTLVENIPQNIHSMMKGTYITGTW